MDEASPVDTMLSYTNASKDCCMPQDLKPCPFCGAGETRMSESTYWTGGKPVVISVRVMHWCPRAEGQPQSLIQIAGRDAESAKAAWNARSMIF